MDQSISFLAKVTKEITNTWMYNIQINLLFLHYVLLQSLSLPASAFLFFPSCKKSQQMNVTNVLKNNLPSTKTNTPG